MNYKRLPQDPHSDEELFLCIDDDGISRSSCSSDHAPFQEWLAEGNTPLPADT